MQNIVRQINKLQNEILDLRRYFHSMPELGFKEFNTSNRITKYLKSCGLIVKTNMGKTGVVGLLEGNMKGKTIGLRADIDALPIKENTQLDFSSNNEGIMHACGHDSHIAIGLGIAMVFSQERHNINGNVKFIFQPAEEILLGARAMLNEKVLDEPKVDAIIGFHNWPDLRSGQIGIKGGPVTAAVDKFKININGKGGHGALPHKSADPIIMTSEIIIAFQKIISREIDPLEAAVISIGRLNTGSTYNVIPDQVKMCGTIRTHDEKIRSFILNRVKEVVDYITQGNKGSYDLKYTDYIPAIFNNIDLTEKAEEKLKTIFGEEIVKLDKPSMVSEDFSLFSEQIPGLYLFLGTRNEQKGLIKSLHNSEYSIDEDMLCTGVRAISEIIIDYLNN